MIIIVLSLSFWVPNAECCNLWDLILISQYGNISLILLPGVYKHNVNMDRMDFPVHAGSHKGCQNKVQRGLAWKIDSSVRSVLLWELS